jgi:RecA-family ATPase/DNA polymerase I-like protein with 3'-5' exonuclease and polymerase domains/5S rRNA maturation endonuclease (ribonuclease M5)
VSRFRRLAQRFIVPAATKSGGPRYAFDLESDGLLDVVTKVYELVVTDLDTAQVAKFGPKKIKAGLKYLSRARYLVGHNILNFDLEVLRCLYGWTPSPGTVVIDTLVAARLILPHVKTIDDQVAAMGGPRLGELHGKQNLESWGARLGGIPKVGTDITDWSTWTPLMEERCAADVAITVALHAFLSPDGYSAEAMALEHAVSPICNRITADGVPFDRNAAARLHERWEARRSELEAQLQQQFPDTKLSSRQQIGALLTSRGWQPAKRTPKTQQPVIDDELLEQLPALYPEFAGLSEYFILGRLLGSLSNGEKAWRRYVKDDDRVHAVLLHVGQPHSRAACFWPNLHAVPNPKKGRSFAAECRALFRTPGDWVFVSCDQAGLQDRGLAHYLAAYDDGAYAATFSDPSYDPHWRAAIFLGLIPSGTVRDKQNRLHEALRDGSKRFRYSLLYGAGIEKSGQIILDACRIAHQIDSTNDLQQKIFGTTKQPGQAALKQVGKRAQAQFEAGLPGLRELKKSVRAQARHGWLPGLDGRRVPALALYTALNYQIVCSEAVLCKRWLVRVYDELLARFRYGWDGDCCLVLWVHDELVACCRPEIADQVGEIMVRHAKEPGEHYGFRVPLEASYTIGRSWAGEPVTAPTTSPDARNVDQAAGGELDVEPDVGGGPDDRLAELVRTSQMFAKFFDLPIGQQEPGDSEPAAEPVGTSCARAQEVPGPIEVEPRGAGEAAGAFSEGQDTPGSEQAEDGQPQANNQYGGYRSDRKPWGGNLAVYLYQNERNEPHLKVIRTKAKTFPQAFRTAGRWLHEKPDGWIDLPYRLPELIAASADRPVWIVEGEKDALELAAIGLIATCNPGGAGKWRSDLTKWFTGRKQVFVLEDNDEAGREHVAKVAEALHGIVPDTRVVRFLELPEKGDVSDWLALGHTRGELTARADAAPKYEPPAAPALPFINMADWDRVMVPEQEWTLPLKIPVQECVIFSGQGGAGKSMEGLHLCAAHALEAEIWGVTAKRGPAIFIDAEDTATVIHRRLEAVREHYGVSFKDLIRGGLHLISLVGHDPVLATVNKNGKIEPTALYKQLLQAAGDIKPVQMVIASSANVFAGNENDRAQAQQFVGLLQRLAMIAQGSTMLISHPSLTGISSGSGLSGSTAWHNAVRARAVMRGVKAEDDEQADNDLREIQFMKNQHGSLAETVVVRWQGGMFLPVEGVASLDDARIDQMFVDLLQRFTGAGRFVSDNPSSKNYAPAQFAREDEAKRNHVVKTAFEAAMRRLFAAGVIRIETYGRPSNPHRRISLV